jgi:hypothetical protein
MTRFLILSPATTSSTETDAWVICYPFLIGLVRAKGVRLPVLLLRSRRAIRVCQATAG